MALKNEHIIYIIIFIIKHSSFNQSLFLANFITKIFVWEQSVWILQDISSNSRIPDLSVILSSIVIVFVIVLYMHKH